MIAQSLASIERIYGPEGRESLENGAGLKLYITPRGQPEPETLKRDAVVLKEWEAALDRQEDFMRNCWGFDLLLSCIDLANRV